MQLAYCIIVNDFNEYVCGASPACACVYGPFAHAHAYGYVPSRRVLRACDRDERPRGHVGVRVPTFHECVGDHDFQKLQNKYPLS